MTNLTKRILVGLVGIPVAIGVVFLGGWLYMGAIVILTFLALKELYGLAESKHVEPNVILGLIWSAGMQIVIARAVIVDPGGVGALQAAMTVALFMAIGTIVTLTFELFRARANALLNTALTVFGVCYISLSLSSLLLLRQTNAESFSGTWGDLGTSLVATLFVSIWAADSVAYFVGMSIGKHKLFPRVSPKKSWEGAIGGLVGSTLAFYGMALWMMPQLDSPLAAACGAMVGIVGPLGDLAESLLKRDAVVKDSSGLLPGHGGVFDRFDSMLFAAPVMVVIVYYKNILHLFIP
ncbi:MAG TPA: phosphatidate cytidylyltransferase [Candidatus Didemnitutus sp.]|nr:phosphatidate cytidylyltransferase [Candidatus Didemnitutus sp.]